jgi:hypothetical protein
MKDNSLAIELSFSSSRPFGHDGQKAAFPWTGAPAFTIVTALLDTSFTKAALYSSTHPLTEQH